MLRTIFIARLVWAVLIPACAADERAQNWSLTPTETIWHKRYTNCDKGYFVDLPSAAVAHATHPPNPNHGFLIRAADPGTKLQVTYEGGRIVGVEDEYNALLAPNARAQLRWDIQNTPGAKLQREKAIRFRGLPAVEATYRCVADGKPQITHELIAFRKADDLIYTLRLVTDPSHYSQDAALFKRIEAGFHIFPITNGECMNP